MKREEKDPSDPLAIGDSDDGLLSPFLQSSFSRGVLIALVPALTACVIARAPQYRVEKILGLDFPIPLDAISLILVAPVYFIVVSWLLLRAAKRSPRSPQKWDRSDTAVLRGLVVFLGVTAIFLLVQFFVILAPVGTCDQRPHIELLWTLDFRELKIQHCMSTAAEINQNAWFYIQPVLLQAWANVFLVGLSIRFMWRAWTAWFGKRGGS